jgi:hypothetical protein
MPRRFATEELKATPRWGQAPRAKKKERAATFLPIVEAFAFNPCT